MQKANEGLARLDSAVNKAPDNVQFGILRANVCYRLPEAFFHRMATAIEDFRYLAQRYEQDNTVFSEEYYKQILDYINKPVPLRVINRPVSRHAIFLIKLFNLAIIYRRLGMEKEVKAALEKLRALDSNRFEMMEGSVNL
ncbi:MAG: hypothetical protein AB1420_13145 [Bacillota bacterium]